MDRTACSAVAGERSVIGALALSLFLPLAVTGQEAPPISVDVQLVVLHATVTDGKGRLVSGLQKQNFQVYEDGRPQTIGLFQHEDAPVAVGLVLDDSGSMRPKRAEVAAGADAFARASNPQDQIFVINFNEYVTFGLPAGQLFSADPASLVKAITNAPARGRTALYDATEAGLQRLRKADLNKKVLIVVSDGGDNASHADFAGVLHDAALSDATIYTIGIFDEDDTDSNPGVLKKIARSTGGEAFFPSRLNEVVSICEKIARDIRSQYTIGYTPAESRNEGGYRSIKVVAMRGSEKLNVRTRTGYIAPEEAEK